MPLYEYEIVEGPDEGKVFEIIQPLSEGPLTTHPETGAKVRKIMSVPGPPQFKGAGCYATDYKKKEKN